MIKPNAWIACGAILAGLAVATGAFGAHGLQQYLPKTGISADLVRSRLETYETAVRYHMYHALAIALLGLVARQASTPSLQAAGYSFLLGLALFSGCLYGYVLLGTRWLAMVVPLGGVAFIAGWIALAWAAFAARE